MKLAKACALVAADIAVRLCLPLTAFLVGLLALVKALAGSDPDRYISQVGWVPFLGMIVGTGLLAMPILMFLILLAIWRPPHPPSRRSEIRYR